VLCFNKNQKLVLVQLKFNYKKNATSKKLSFLTKQQQQQLQQNERWACECQDGLRVGPFDTYLFYKLQTTAMNHIMCVTTRIRLLPSRTQRTARPSSYAIWKKFNLQRRRSKKQEGKFTNRERGKLGSSLDSRYVHCFYVVSVVAQVIVVGYLNVFRVYSQAWSTVWGMCAVIKFMIGTAA